MINSDAVGNYYTIGHIVQFSGLTDRTIRSYISSGILCGEKINGLWHFTPEQVCAFMSHPMVQPSIRAKRNALVYDFLLDTKKTEQQICIILDIPNTPEKDISEYFCYTINNGNYTNIKFSFDSQPRCTPRVIIKGNTDDVLEIVNGYYRNF